MKKKNQIRMAEKLLPELQSKMANGDDSVLGMLFVCREVIAGRFQNLTNVGIDFKTELDIYNATYGSK